MCFIASHSTVSSHLTNAVLPFSRSVSLSMTNCAAPWTAGLSQQRVSVANDTAAAVEAAVWDESQADVVEGAIMAYVGGKSGTTPSYASRNGTTYSWGDYVGWIYKGFVFLEGGATNTFGGFIDDCIVLTIDGTQILRQNNYNAKAQYGTFAPAATGWFPIEIRMGNGNSGSGAVNDNYTFGLGYNTNGTKTVSASAMSPLLDPGDGSFLRPFARVLTLVSAKRAAGGGIAATVSLSFGNPAGTLRAFWGATDGGTDAAAWANSADLAEVGLAGTNLVATIPVADPAATPYVRLRVSDGEGLERWTAVHWLDASQPLIEYASAAPDGDRMTVSGSLLSVGSGRDFGLRLLWGYAEDLSDAQSVLVASAAGPFSATVPVVPGTNGWWRLVATTSDGGYDATIPAAFTTLAGSVLLGAASATSPTHHTFTVSGGLDVLGAGATTVSLWYGDDANPSNFVKIAEIPVSAAGSLSIVGTIPGAPRTVHYQLRSVNVAPGGTTWTSASRVFTVTTVDQATYTWKIEKTEGEWADPENWDVSGIADPADCLGYPDHAKATVKFIPGTSANIHVAGNRTFGSMDIAVANVDLAFTGDGTTSSSLSGNIGGGEMSGSTFTFSGIYVYETNTFDIGADNNSHGGNVGNVRVLVTDGAELSFSGWWHVRGSNTWVVVSNRASIVWRNGATDDAGVILYNRFGGIVLDDGAMRLPCVAHDRYSKAGPQHIRIGGKYASLQATRYFRRWKESEDTGVFDLDLGFLVPLKGWEPGGGDAPIRSELELGTDSTRLFGYRSSNPSQKIVLSVSPDSKLVHTGRVGDLQLVERRAGIYTNGVAWADTKYARFYYTYGWEPTRPAAAFSTSSAYDAGDYATKDGALYRCTAPVATPGAWNAGNWTATDEPPTGIAVHITGLGGTIMILR